MKSKVKIGLVQINNSFSGQNYLPYSIACLESYAMTHSKRADQLEFISPIYKRMPVDDIVEHLLDVDIAGFSTYVWNYNISCEVARRLKRQRPDITIVFGGPQVPNIAEDFLKENRFVDLAIHNEGEKVFTELVDMFPGKNYQNLKSTSFLDFTDNYIKTNNEERIRNLDEIPSPFLNGMFDTLIQDNPEESWIGLWETNRGCPFKCTFCDWGSATASKLNKFNEDRLHLEVDWFAENKIEYIFCCDANFGIQARDIDIANYVATTKQQTGFPVALSVQNTKNATERAYQAQKILSDAGLNKGVALSMQSVDVDTLDAIKRENISLDSYWELQRRFTEDKVETYSDLILGLPGETYHSFIKGVDVLIESGQHNRIQFNNLSILPNAEMGDPEYIEKYGLQIIRSEIINIHGSKELHEDDVAEYQDLVIATNAMPAEDWQKTRAFCWMTAFLHFDKIMQYPLIITHELFGLKYSQIIERFIEQAHSQKYPMLNHIANFFINEAASIQKGGFEYVFSKDWLGIFWPADEYVYIDMMVSDTFNQFYEEAGALLVEILNDEDIQFEAQILDDALTLNRSLVSRPFIKEDLSIDLFYDVKTFCEEIKVGKHPHLQQQPLTLVINRANRHYDDLQKWCQEVVWWGNKKGAYLYDNDTINYELAGHY